MNPPGNSKGQQTTWRWRTDPNIINENRSPLTMGESMMF